MARLAGSVQGLVSVDLIGEGTDMPCHGIHVAPGLSESLYLQMAGRVLRPVYARGHDLEGARGRAGGYRAGGKPAGLLFDHVRGLAAHGRPHDHRSGRWMVADPRRRVVSGRGARGMAVSSVTLHGPCAKSVCPVLRPCVRGEHARPSRRRTAKLVESLGHAGEIMDAERRRQRMLGRESAGMVDAGISGARADHILAARAERPPALGAAQLVKKKQERAVSV